MFLGPFGCPGRRSLSRLSPASSRVYRLGEQSPPALALLARAWTCSFRGCVPRALVAPGAWTAPPAHGPRRAPLGGPKPGEHPSRTRVGWRPPSHPCTHSPGAAARPTPGTGPSRRGPPVPLAALEVKSGRHGLRRCGPAVLALRSSARARRPGPRRGGRRSACRGKARTASGLDEAGAEMGLYSAPEPRSSSRQHSSSPVASLQKPARRTFRAPMRRSRPPP